MLSKDQPGADGQSGQASQEGLQVGIGEVHHQAQRGHEDRLFEVQARCGQGGQQAVGSQVGGDRASVVGQAGLGEQLGAPRQYVWTIHEPDAHVQPSVDRRVQAGPEQDALAQPAAIQPGPREAGPGHGGHSGPGQDRLVWLGQLVIQWRRAELRAQGAGVRIENKVRGLVNQLVGGSGGRGEQCGKRRCAVQFNHFN